MTTENLLTIEVDGKEYTAKKGQMLIEVTDAAGIDIPRFCYHPKLSTAASCRMCLVDVEKAPKPLPACATPVMDGMKIFTRSRRSRDAQRNVMEFLLINHPLDCPVCDQGGECELQDVALGYGRGVSRFAEGKRVVGDKNIGPLVATEMTRCIHCTRCVRFLDEIAGTDELGGIGRGDRTEISTYIERSVDSELSGNIVDVCPVGALTNKVFKFSARPWELIAKSGISTHDSLGSNLYYHMRRGEVLRVVPRENDDLNESWLSDRDRYSYKGLYSEARLTSPRIKENGQWRDASWQEALDKTADSLKVDSKAAWLGGNLSNEEYFLTQKLFRALGSNDIDHRLRQIDVADQSAWPQCPGLGINPATIAEKDVIVLIGADLRSESPLLAHRVRQAVKNGAKLVSIDVEQRDLLCSVAQHDTVALHTMADHISKHKDILEKADNGLIIVGAVANQSRNASAIRIAASSLASATASRMAVLNSEANAAGAWLCGAVPHRIEGGDLSSTEGMAFQSSASQDYQTLLLNGVELQDTSLAAQLVASMEKASMVVVMTAYADTDLLDHADVLLPVGMGPEIDASYTNLLGQTASVEACANLPGDAKAGWKVLRMLAEQLGVESLCYNSIAELAAVMAPIYEQAQSHWDLSDVKASASAATQVMLQWGVYDVDAQTRHAQALQQTAQSQSPVCRVSKDILAQDGRIELEIGGHKLVVDAVVDEALAAQSIIINPVRLDSMDALLAIGDLTESTLKVSEVSA